MALGQEAAQQLWQELIGGYSLNARLLALLEHPLDILGHEAAKAMSQELSRVFMVSLFTLKPGDSIRVAGLRTMAPEATSIGLGSPAKDIRICSGEEIGPRRKSRGDVVTKKEITASPHKEGYRWRKYGQKNIRNRKFPRLYYSCRYSHERGCRAKKQVQRQDSSSDAHRPMFHVTFVNQHTCHQVRPSRSISDNATDSPTMNTTATRNGAHFDHAAAVHVGGNAQLENQIMTGTFARVIGGATSRPQPVEVSQLSDPASYVPPGLLEVSMSLEHRTTVAEMRGRGSPFPPVEAPTAPYSSSSLPHTTSRKTLISKQRDVHNLLDAHYSNVPSHVQATRRSGQAQDQFLAYLFLRDS
nr:WRKY DNA-binding transcription factor 70-like [Lolium perenne]